MSERHFPKPARELLDRRHVLAPDAEDAFRGFSKAVDTQGIGEASRRFRDRTGIGRLTGRAPPHRHDFKGGRALP
ncbi:hypothetical protein DI396_10045 [Litorivita pollutaquae]|uniref:Uncharacterized protein n=1 Tax=Litorivita pollutaquae TaxID=2200892 RepID=A0A2V4MP36_9RHOB|nr:hypothetical protein DI396_10045 [Litorivita pollutaquae]